jgi:hypothetical protein
MLQPLSQPSASGALRASCDYDLLLCGSWLRPARLLPAQVWWGEERVAVVAPADVAICRRGGRRSRDDGPMCGAYGWSACKVLLHMQITHPIGSQVVACLQSRERG